jgi:plastocyanin
MSTKYCVINMYGIVMPRETGTKITFLAGAIMCCIVAMLFFSNYSGSENHIITSAFAASVDKGSQNQPNIQGSNIYQTQTIVLGKNTKNLVILIPNEGHEDPIASTKKELRVINQPYIPQNAVVNVGTTVTWLNADAGHHHTITLVDNNTKKVVYDSARFDNFNASKPFTLNNVGDFAYSGPSYDKMWPNYKMNGTITVVNQPLDTIFNSTGINRASSSSSTSSAGTNTNSDTVATLMVPSRLLGNTVSNLKSQGFTIDNQYPFMSLRGAGSQSGGEKQQVLLVLTSSSKNLNQVTSALAQVASTLPYK